MTVTAESPSPDLLQLLVLHSVVQTDTAGVLVGRLQAVEAVILLLLKVGLRVGAAVEPVALVARPAGAVEAAQGVGAVGEQRAGPVLALIEVRLLAQRPTPPVVTVALQHNQGYIRTIFGGQFLGDLMVFGHFQLSH